MDNNAQQDPRRFIFSDEFYDEIEKINNDDSSEQNINNEIPQTNNQIINEQPNIQEPVVTNNNIYPDININTNNDNNLDINNDTVTETNPNDFFKKSFSETTTVYDNVGNTISQTVSDGNNVETIVEAPSQPIFDYPQDDKPDLGIPSKNDIVIPDVVAVNNDLVDVPNIGEQSNINLNVETGVDKDLESELINNKQEYVPQINYFDIDPYQNEKANIPKYRAVRTPGNPIKLTEDTNNSDISLDTNNIDPIYQPDAYTDDNKEMDFIPQAKPIEITEDINEVEEETVVEVVRSDLLDRLAEKEKETGKISILARYGDDFCSRDYITNPAIGRDREIKELGLILLTPEKSAILVGKPGIGKTSIVEGLAYQLQRNNVPDALKGYVIISVKTTSLLGSTTNGETRLQTLIDELKELDKIILFVDEIHMLMGATNESSLDFANMFKESLGRGSIKMIGATTSDEYERYVLRDKAFVRRFQRVDVNEPTRDETIQILMGTLPKIEKTTGAKLKYTYFIKTEIMSFITDITTEYKRVYGIGSRYPDICITLLNQAFSEAVFNNRNEVNIFDIRNAIQNSKNIYPDVIKKELVNFDNKFKGTIEDERNSQ